VAAKVGVWILALGVWAGCAGNRAGTAAPTPPGVALLDRMRSKYVGKWFKTVTFSQQTIQKRPTGVVDTSTWYEALKSPDRLRIDFGDPKNGNGVIYTADSLYVIRSDTIARTVASGNPFLPFVAGVYAQPLDTTLKQIGVYKFDLTKSYKTTYQGHPAYVVGSTSERDTLSPQFWVDGEKLVVVRMLVALNPNAPTDVADIRLDDYRKVGGGWLAVHVAIMRGGEVIQREDYADWRGDVELPDDFFVAQMWGKVPHWHR